MGKDKNKDRGSIFTPPGCLPGETPKECRDRRKGLEKRAMTQRQLKKQQGK